VAEPHHQSPRALPGSLRQDGWRWRVIRTSNAYIFCDPKAAAASKPDQRMGTPDQEVSKPLRAPGVTLSNVLERALTALQEAITAKDGIEQGVGG
jgi:hypothetical protein